LLNTRGTRGETKKQQKSLYKKRVVSFRAIRRLSFSLRDVIFNIEIIVAVIIAVKYLFPKIAPRLKKKSINKT